MESKNSIPENPKSLTPFEISQAIGCSLSHVSRLIHRLNLKHDRKGFKKKSYALADVKRLQACLTPKKIEVTFEPEIVKYYPLKTIETYYIYESKMNTL